MRSRSSGTAIPAVSTPTNRTLRRAYFHAMKSPVHVDVTRARAVALKNTFMGSGLGTGEAGADGEDFGASDLGTSGLGLSGFTLTGGGALRVGR